DDDPETLAVQRETIEVGFLTAVHLLPVQQRAAFLLRDVLGMRAVEAAGVLDISVPALKSALQRARSRLRAAQAAPAPAGGRPDGDPPDGDPQDGDPQDGDRPSSHDERQIARRYVTALQHRDGAAMAALLH